SMSWSCGPSRWTRRARARSWTLLMSARRSYPIARRRDLLFSTRPAHRLLMNDERLGHVLVTGGTSGIGRATALRLAEGGARVSAVGRSEERGADLEQTARNRGLEARFFAADLTRPGAAAEALDRAVASFGPLDAAVNSAAGVVAEGPKRLHELGKEAF